jgi:hypothetical protein
MTMDSRPPIDLPDDFGLDEDAPDFSMAFIMTAALWIVLIIAAVLIWGAMA